MDKPYRSVVKAFSWRLTGTADTIIVSFIITGTLKVALSIGAVEVFTKMVLYFFHERIWNKISFGRAKQQEVDFEI